MQLIQILLPLNTNDETSLERINQVREDLTPRFGGLTLYLNNPAEGLWKDGDAVEEDFIIVAEVMNWIATGGATTGQNSSGAFSRTRSSFARWR
jgi:hypothetical protein